METPQGAVVHPIAKGRIVRHRDQTWSTALLRGTATVLEVTGPFAGDGGYEYTVLTGKDFDDQPGYGNPMNHRAVWTSDVTVPVGYVPHGPGTHGVKSGT